MTRKFFKPTCEQKSVIGHFGSAFISACPGAGKTQVMVERARNELKKSESGQGLAFLSFTNAVISELRSRLQAEALLTNPIFPHYVGTFDSFIWQFFIAPFGIPGHTSSPRLIPDLNQRTVTPYPKAQPLPLSCFERDTGRLIPENAKRVGFDAGAEPGRTAKYESRAKEFRQRFLARGELSFEDAREIAKTRIAPGPLATKLSVALAARFREIIIDEAQDCNPADIEIINWLRCGGIVTKIICDPHQSIYEFRGGVTDHLFVLRDSFDQNDRLVMSGNFRSSQNICKAIAGFRTPGEQKPTDQALGPAASDTTKVHVLHYPGNSIPTTIGQEFKKLLQEHKFSLCDCPVISSTRDAACKAIGQPTESKTQDRILRLALAVASFHAGVEIGARKDAMQSLHCLVLELGEKMGRKTYHQYVVAENLNPEEWRPEILKLLQALRYDPTCDASSDCWLSRARALLAPYLGANSGSIAQALRKHADLAGILACKPMSDLSAKTIHSVKGLEFPAVCVVLSKNTCKDIIDYLNTGQPSMSAEAARKLYVGASRAQRLLVIAVPKKQGSRLVDQIKKTGAEITEIMLGGET